MGICPSLCTGNPPTWTSTYSGTVTITSQQNLVLSTPSPIGPKQYVAILSFSPKRRPKKRKALTQCKYPKWALDKVEKRLNKPNREVTDGANNRAPQAPSPLPMKLKPSVILLYLTHKVSVKVPRRSVGGMAYRPTSKVVMPSGTYWSPPRTKVISNVVTFPVMMNT